MSRRLHRSVGLSRPQEPESDPDAPEPCACRLLPLTPHPRLGPMAAKMKDPTCRLHNSFDDVIAEYGRRTQIEVERWTDQIIRFVEAQRAAVADRRPA